MATPQFTIRTAREDDAVAIAQAHVDARRVAMPWLPVLHTFEDAVRFFADFVIPNQIVLVAEAEEGVVGFLAIEGSYVEHLYVAPAHQGIGIGDVLWQKGEGAAPRGPDAMDL
jgi:ribosomal protein S18 acetylase RimI-like enzyme